MENKIDLSARMADKWPKKKEEEMSIPETKKTADSTGGGTKVTKWGNMSRNVILLILILLPVWFLPFKGGALGMSKSVFVFALALIAVVFYLVHVLQEGVFKYVKSYAFGALLLILATGLVSSLMSQSPSVSLFGEGGETGTFAFIFVSAVLLFLVAQHFQSEKSVILSIALIMIPSVAVFVFEILRWFVGTSLWGYLPRSVDTLIGSWNELAIFAGLVAIMSLIFIESFNPKQSWKTFLYFCLGLSFVVMIFVNFTAAWVVLGSFALTFFVYLFSMSGQSRNFVRLPLFVVLIALLFVLARPVMSDIVSSVGLDTVEVRPSWGTTYQVTKDTLSSSLKNIILGSGPNTFVQDWTKFKPISINQTIFWAVDFEGGIGLIPTFVATTGVLGAIAWLAFFAFLLVYGLKSIGFSGDKITKSLLLGTFFGSVYLWVFNIMYVPNNYLVVLTFLMTGLFFAMLAKTNMLGTKEFSLTKKTSLSFVSSLLIVLFLIISVATFYLLLQKYWAAYSYEAGLIAFNVEGSIDNAQVQFLKATRFDNQERFYRALTELGLVRLSQLLQQQLPQDEARTQFQNNLAFVIQNAQAATRVNPENYQNWMSLGQVYENIIPFQIEGARTVALDSYAKALEKSPFDPRPLLSSAQVEVQSGNTEEAVAYLNSALKLKGNYTQALFLSSQLAAQRGDLVAAIQQSELARLTSPNDIGVLFQLALLYYQNKDYTSARSVFERAISFNPTYSNARYFLGLIYDREGRTAEAIEQFEEVEKLNSDNDEIKRILSNLRAGRSALSSISPPEPVPEEREDLPIIEEVVPEEISL